MRYHYELSQLIQLMSQLHTLSWSVTTKLKSRYKELEKRGGVVVPGTAP